MISLVVSTANVSSNRVLSSDQVQELRRLVLSKDRRVAGLLQAISWMNVAAVFFIPLALHIAVPDEAYATLLTYAREALAAFVLGALLGSLVYGTRRNAVVVRLSGMQPRFRATWPILFAAGAGLLSLATGTSRFANGLAAIW